MNKLITYGIGVALSAFCLSSCSSDVPPTPLPTVCPYLEGATLPREIPLSEISEESVNNTNEFALRFFAESLGDDNLCLSPLSVASVLGMLANGDDGDTRDEVLSLLGFKTGKEGAEALNRYNNILLSNLPALDEEARCLFSNSLWYSPDKTLQSAFTEKIFKNFGTRSIPIDPSGEGGMGEINYFVEYQTGGLIKNFLESPLKEKLAFLNTIYFKGAWTDSFDKDSTTPEEFINVDRSTVKTDFMHNTSWHEYSRSSDGTEAVRLPYGDGDFRMTLILPPSGNGTESLKRACGKRNIKELNESFYDKKISLSLPKFETESKDCKTLDVLKRMGLNKACDPAYGFHNIVADPCFLSIFIHAAKITVDEDGTEGAAASLGGMLETAAPGGQNPVDPYKISFNRPFIFMIDERSSGAILFIGAVTNFND